VNTNYKLIHKNPQVIEAVNASGLLVSIELPRQTASSSNEAYTEPAASVYQLGIAKIMKINR
jgi:hypothetical protein